MVSCLGLDGMVFAGSALLEAVLLDAVVGLSLLAGACGGDDDAAKEVVAGSILQN